MIVFGWIVELEQAGDLRSVIRRFTFIWECLLFYEKLDINTCKHSIFVIMIIVFGGLLCWSMRVACMVL